MAQEAVVRDPLTADMIEAGREISERLSQSDLDIACAFWLYSADSNDWRLMVATPLVDQEGPKRAYAEIGRNLPGNIEQRRGFDVFTLTAVSPNHPLVKALRSALRVSPGSGGVRFTRNRINDVFVEDSYVYFAR